MSTEQPSKHSNGKGKASQITERANWDMNNTAIFVSLCVAEVLSGRRPQTHLTKEAWDNVKNGFEKETGKKYTHLQFKNRWDTLKTDWNLWKGLLRGETGLGMDPTTGAIDASDDWWTEKLQRFPDADKFRNKPLAQADELEIMFANSSATDEDAWALSSGQLPPHMREMDDVLLNSDDEIKGLDGMTPDAESNPTFDGNTRKRVGQSSGSTKLRPVKKKTSTAAQLNNLLSQIVSDVESTSTPSTSFRGEVDDKYSASKCLKIMDNMPELEDSPLYYVGMIAFQKRVNRELFISSPPHRRMGFLEILRSYVRKI